MTTTVSATDRWKDSFGAAAAVLLDGAPAWLADARRAALDRFLARGIPGRRDEQWKYTDLRALERRAFTGGTPVNAPADAAFAGLAGPRLCFVDGRFEPARSRVPALPAGAIVGSLADALASKPQVVRRHLDAVASDARSSFVALNSAFAVDGAFVWLPDGCVLEAPIELTFLSAEHGLSAQHGAEQGTPHACHPRVIVATGKSCAVHVVEHWVGSGGADDLTNAVTELDVGPNSRVGFTKVQRDVAGFHIASVFARVADHGRFAGATIDLGGRLVRTDVSVELAGPGAEVDLHGLYQTVGREHVDNHVRVDHQAPHTRSDLRHRGVLAGRSRAVFNGRVQVGAGATKTDARQSNANLLLSADAEIDTKPELEIHTDDVKCSHGATVGQLDEDQVFYLRTRCLSDAEARALLTVGFADEVLAGIGPEALREPVGRLFRARLPEGFPAPEIGA